MAIHNELGVEGEIAARSHLLSMGYAILHTNWRKGRHELDIIATFKNKLVVVEVKTRSKTVVETGNVMSRNKEKSLIKAVNKYLQCQEGELDCQIDLLIMEKKDQGFNVIHIKDAIGQE